MSNGNLQSIKAIGCGSARTADAMEGCLWKTFPPGWKQVLLVLDFLSFMGKGSHISGVAILVTSPVPMPGWEPDIAIQHFPRLYF